MASEGQRAGGAVVNTPLPTLLLMRLDLEAMVNAVKVQQASVSSCADNEGLVLERGRPTAGGEGSVGWGL